MRGCGETMPACQTPSDHGEKGRHRGEKARHHGETQSGRDAKSDHDAMQNDRDEKTLCDATLHDGHDGWNGDSNDGGPNGRDCDGGDDCDGGERDSASGF